MGKIDRENPRTALLARLPLHRRIIGALLLCLLLLSCSGFPVKNDRPRGVYHRVRSGETLSIIARAYQVDLQELAEINNIDNPDRIGVDTVIFIPEAHQIVDDVMAAARPARTAPSRAAETVGEEPAAGGAAAVQAERDQAKPGEIRGGATAPAPSAPGKPAAAARPPAPRPRTEREPAGRTPQARPEREEPAAQTGRPQEKEPRSGARPEPKTEAKSEPRAEPKGEQLQFDKKRFIWPVRGRVVSQFGIQPNRMYHNGIRIAAAEGALVQAAADGTVIFSAPLKDYGETIIIQHEGQYATVYTHLGVRTVRDESRVRKGDRIAYLGKGENREEPTLHFEIRHKNKARNPLFFLP